MNDLIIIETSRGLCAYVLQKAKEAGINGQLSVVVGHDHRYNSERWAALTAAAFIIQGVKVYLLRGLVHTPMFVCSPPPLNPLL
jgi:phosphoglucomutase